MFKPISKGAVFYFRLFLGILFFMASLGKITDLKGFTVAVLDYNLLPQFLAVPFSLVLPWAELLCGILLIFGCWVRLSAAAIFGMLVSFTFAVTYAWLKNMDIDCGCFDIPLGPSKVGPFIIIRNIILSGMALTIILLRKKREREV